MSLLGWRGWRAPRTRPEPGQTAVGMAALDLARFDRLAFVTQQPSRRGLGGEHASRRRAPSAEFVDYRPYVPGDDLRRVDWNVYGRLGALEVKLTEARERTELLLALDCSASMAWGTPNKFDRARQLALALAYVGLVRFDLVRLVRLGYSAPNDALGPLHGRARLPAVERFLETTTTVGELDVPRLLVDTVGRRGQRVVVLVSDLLTASGAEAALDGVQARGGELVVAHVLAPQERQPDALGDVELVDAESGSVLEVGLSAEVRDRYCARFASWLERQRELCLSHGARYVLAPTERPLAELMLSDMRQAGVLR